MATVLVYLCAIALLALVTVLAVYATGYALYGGDSSWSVAQGKDIVVLIIALVCGLVGVPFWLFLTGLCHVLVKGGLLRRRGVLVVSLVGMIVPWGLGIVWLLTDGMLRR
jgi:hypothetical protein